MSYHYLVKSPEHLVQHLATHLVSAEYFFYVQGCLRAENDPLTLDAKLILKHKTYRTKSQNYRRANARACYSKVQYLRCGRHFFLLATLGTHETFFTKEGWKDLREAPLYFAGYSITWNSEDGVVVRMHREVFNRLRRELLPLAGRRTMNWWLEALGPRFPFETGYAGVRTQWFALLRAVNAERKRLRQEPIDWQLCVNKKLRPEPVFLPTPPEVLSVIEHYRES